MARSKKYAVGIASITAALTVVVTTGCSTAYVANVVGKRYQNNVKLQRAVATQTKVFVDYDATLVDVGNAERQIVVSRTAVLDLTRCRTDHGLQRPKVTKYEKGSVPIPELVSEVPIRQDSPSKSDEFNVGKISHAMYASNHESGDVWIFVKNGNESQVLEYYVHELTSGSREAKWWRPISIIPLHPLACVGEIIMYPMKLVRELFSGAAMSHGG